MDAERRASHKMSLAVWIVLTFGVPVAFCAGAEKAFPSHERAVHIAAPGVVAWLNIKRARGNSAQREHNCNGNNERREE